MRRRGAGGAAALVVTCGLVAGACSGTAGPQSGPSSPGARVIATFAAVDGAASTRQLTDDAHELTVRLRILGDSGDSASVRGHAVVVSGRTGLPAPASALLTQGIFQIRPALCFAARYTPPTAGNVAGPLPIACSQVQYSLLAPTLIVNTSTGTSNYPAIPPDPVLASYPSSSAAYDDSHPANTVLVPQSGGGGIRYLLGPAELNGTAVASAQATYESPQWLIDVTLTSAGASAWDALAQKYFHEIIGIDLDGQAVSAPLMQPSSSSFVSFGGRMQISGNFTKKAAEEVAAALSSGPLTTPLSS